jgi:hypothetical protein
MGICMGKKHSQLETFSNAPLIKMLKTTAKVDYIPTSQIKVSTIEKLAKSLPAS